MISGSPTCKVKFSNMTVSMLVDSGADVRLIDSKIVKKIPKKFIISTGPSNMEVRGVWGQRRPTVAKCVIKTRIGDCTYNITFTVIDNLGKTGLLGSDFFEAVQATLSYKDKVLTMAGNNAVLLTPKNEVNDYSLVRMVKRTIIPAKTSVVALVQIRNKDQNGEKVITPLSLSGPLKDSPGLTIAPTLVQSRKSGKVPLCIVNDTVSAQVIPGKAVIAIAEDPSLVLQQTELRDIKTPSDILDLVTLPEVDEDKKSMLRELFQDFKHLFAESDNDLGRTDLVEMTIETGSQHPIRQKPYRSALSQKETIEKHISTMLDADIIRESASPWASPVVIVPKKDGSLRFCIDYRRLNSATRKNCYPLPNIDDIFASLGGAKFFSCLDLKSGYWQIAVHENDKPKTAFVSHQGLYEFNVMPFGLTNAPAVFQELMNNVLKGIRNKFAMAYIDDILVYSETYEDHIRHLSEVFLRLEKANLKLKASKCEFLKDKVHYLGHVISQNGIEPNPDKVASIKTMAPPTNVRGVRSFLGAVGYYMKFIPQFAQIARPLVLLTKKNNRFVWGADCQSSFETLKGKLASSSILTFPEPSLPYKLYTDASQYAVGAVLTQDRAEGEKVIQYVSHKVNAGQQKWPTIEREAYAIIHAVKKLRHYLYGSDFTIFTDHKPLKSVFTAEMKNTRVQRWAIQLEEYSPRIEYKPGKLNMVADLMSRLHATGPSSDHTINVIDTDRLTDTLPDHLDNERNIQEVDKSEVHKPLLASTNITDLQKEDKFCCQVKKSIEEGTSDHNVQNFVIMDDLLYHISGSVRLDPEPHLQLVIPKAITETILKGYHDESGHLGIDKTYDKIRTRYFWANMYHDVVLHISKCDLCRSRKLRATRKRKDTVPERQQPMRAARLTLSDALVPLPEQYVAQPLPRVFKRNETPTLNHDDEDGDDVPTGKTVERESDVHSHGPKPTGKEESDEAAIKTAPSTTVVTPSPIAHGYFLRGRKRHRGSDNESPINADNTPEVPEPVHKRVKTNNLHEDSGAMDVSTIETSSKLSKFYHWVTSTFADKKVSRGIGMFRMIN